MFFLLKDWPDPMDYSIKFWDPDGLQDSHKVD